ncbi:ribonuclease E/G [Mangrovicella endophytica]|uniref:ribonuclease E/G n=1 Tax=Mangrovicella endophytica TaxID=2066697 RepID=UPI000C9DCEEE|nr:ribonuclease E/G [Mangrovicella endophytica]
MANKMLIDASHPEETRVVVVRGSRIEEFDFESEHKKQLKGNIYLAKVTRVEPSLQAAFVEYGGNRHGFLAFSEIHPDYYQIPVADRQALIEEELARDREDEEHEERKATKPKSRSRRGGKPAAARTEGNGDDAVAEALPDQNGSEASSSEATHEDVVPAEASDASEGESVASADSSSAESDNAPSEASATDALFAQPGDAVAEKADSDDEEHGEEEEVDEIGAEDAMEEVAVRQSRPRRQYKIQEVIKRRQILLVQVVKEERGNKGAALSTYLSLAGRYSVLMPNTARGGGISRKITNAADRKRLKEVARDLEVPRGMGIILRTAGANRTKAEVKRDYEYLMRLWENVRSLTLSSSAPALVYEEGSLIKRSIRDLYNKDIDQILVAGESGYREAKDFMRMLMPSQAKVVQPYRDPTPIFVRQGIEAQLDRMLQPHVTLKSGGYIIINQTEALVAIDVNSGRSTREHSVEDTAYQTNLEAAEEVARQLRLRDLAGLIVIDFIDMEEKRNNRAVEKRLKDCLKNDRARIQLGRISHFGLMEMSRQRIRASVLESTMQTCPTCGGTGHIRSESSLALHVLRSIEEHLQKHNSHDLIVKVPTATAIYVLNEKRGTINDLERLHGLRILIEADESNGHQGIKIEHGAEAVRREPKPEFVHPETVAAADIVEDAADEEDAVADESEGDEAETTAPSDNGEERDGNRRRKRRRRRRRGDDNGEAGDAGEAGSVDESDEAVAADAEGSDEDAGGDDTQNGASSEADEGEDEGGRDRKRRRRGRRGGRRNREDATAESGEATEFGDGAVAEAAAAMVEEDSSAFVVQPVDAAFETASDDGVTATAPEGDEPASESAPAAESSDESGSAPSAEERALADARLLEEDGGEVQAEVTADTGSQEPQATGATDETVPEEAPTPKAPATPQITSNGEQADEDPDKPKRTGWWARRSFF